MDQKSQMDLVQEVKQICRSDINAKNFWCKWCDTNMEGTKDPARMDEAALTTFIEGWQMAGGSMGSAAGVAVRSAAPVVGTLGGLNRGLGAVTLNTSFLVNNRAAKPPPTGQDLAEVVKIGQRTSPSWKTAWVAYCELTGTQTFDPSKHPQPFLQEFFDFLGSAALAAIQLQQPASGSAQQEWGAPAAKRPRLEDQSSDATVQQLAGKVKELQKTDPTAKQLWSDFCESRAGGVYDPTRHNEASLHAFFQHAGFSID